ncbi:MAG: hypothetical protein KJP02_05870 [Octadecabacter sp.]|nr:hypothetical protein [Octadecabacter sp.]
MTKLTKLTAVILSCGVAGAAFAQDADPNIDLNGDGFYSFPELSTVVTDVTDETFTQMDTTGDGLLDMSEVAMAQEAGLLPMQDG